MDCPLIRFRPRDFLIFFMTRDFSDQSKSLQADPKSNSIFSIFLFSYM